VNNVCAQVTSAAATIGGTAAVVAAARQSRRNLIVQNLHASQDLYVGPSGVTTSSGVKVAAGQSVGFVDFNGTLYGIASGAGTDVRVLEIYG
jgi:hypothetical protein